MKKYYVYFTDQYTGDEYVMRFKIRGSLRYDYQARCFIDKDIYTRSTKDLVNMLLSDNYCGYRADFALLLDHDRFVECRASGIERFWVPDEIIDWDPDILTMWW